ncbi:MAG: hypothetical protein L6V84_07570 [Oscillospiraceae bacterium]|nr:MAG: hypothetical protein L6V84_07570 [Oscillospiraceae bacterium]
MRVLLGAFGSAHHIQHKADNQKQRQRRPKIGNVLLGEPSPPGHGHQPVHGDLFRRLSFRGGIAARRAVSVFRFVAVITPRATVASSRGGATVVGVLCGRLTLFHLLCHSHHSFQYPSRVG